MFVRVRVPPSVLNKLNMNGMTPELETGLISMIVLIIIFGALVNAYMRNKRRNVV